MREAAEINAMFAAERAVPAPANDDLDAILADLPLTLEHIRAPVVTDLDGNAIEAETVPACPSTAPALVPDLVTRRPARRARKSLLRERENRAARLAYRRSTITSASAPTVAPLAEHPTPTPANSNTLTPTSPSPQTSTLKTDPKGGRRKKSRARLVASWEEAGELARLDYVNRAGMLRGRPFAWTLNVAPDVEKAANDNARGALDYLRRAVDRSLKRVPALKDAALPMWLVVETTDAGRIHLHGACFTDDPEHLPAIARALARAGGAWSGAGREYQVDLAPQRDPDAWAAYPVKRQARTRRHLREAADLALDVHVPIASWSRDLVADAKRLLGRERRAIGRL